MRKWTIPSALLLLCLLFLLPDQGTLRSSSSTFVFSSFLFISIDLGFSVQNRKLKFIRILGIYGFSGRKLQANAEGNTDELVDPPKVEDKIGAVPNGLSTDSDVAKR